MEDQDASRREALKAVASTALAVGLGNMLPGTAIAQAYSREELKKQTAAILNYTTSPAFLNELNAVLSAPKDRQLEEAARRFDPNRLRASGLEGPPKTRLSTRVFDETTGKSTILGAPPAPVTLNVAVAGRRPSQRDVEAVIDKNRIESNAATSVCVCVGGGACVGVGGG